MKMLYKESLMKVRYLLLVASTIVMFLACAGSREQVKKKPEITPNEISAVPELKEPLDAVALAKIRELKQNLVMNGVPGKWFDEQLQNETFQIHPTIDRYFQQSAEKQVDQDKKRDASWYFVRVGVDAKIEKGKRFIEAHSDIFKKAEARHGIHQELVAAIVGNTKALLPVSVRCEGEYGVNGLAIGVPAYVGEQGVTGILQLKLAVSDREAFDKAAAELKTAHDNIAAGAA